MILLKERKDDLQITFVVFVVLVMDYKQEEHKSDHYSFLQVCCVCVCVCFNHQSQAVWFAIMSPTSDL